MSENTEMTAGTATEEPKGDTLAAVLEKKNEQIPHEILSSEKQEGSRIRYSVKVPAETFAPKVDEVLADYRRQANIPGFRRGKAPMTLVRNRFAKHAKEDAVRKMVQRLSEIIAEETKVNPVTQPTFEGWEEGENKDVTVNIILEVRPEINLTDESFSGITVEVVKGGVTDEFVADEIETIREKNATFEAQEGASFEKFDGIRLSLAATSLEGEELPNLALNDQYSQDIHEHLPAALVEGLAGHKAGETFDISEVVISPEEQVGEPMKANFKATIHEVKKRVLPELDDEFAKDVSDEYETLDDLKTAIRKELEEKDEQRKRNETLGGIYQELIKRVEFEVPPSMQENLVNNRIYRMEQNLNQYGMTLRKMNQDFVNNFLARSRQEAVIEGKNLLLNDAVGKFLNLEVSDAQVEEEIAKIAEAQGRKPLAIRAQLEAQKRLDAFKGDLRLRLVNDKLISMVTVNLVDAKSEEEDSASEG